MTKEYDRYRDDMLDLSAEQFFAKYGHSKEFEGAFEVGREVGRDGNAMENPYQANDARMEYERGHEVGLREHAKSFGVDLAQEFSADD